MADYRGKESIPLIFEDLNRYMELYKLHWKSEEVDLTWRASNQPRSCTMCKDEIPVSSYRPAAPFDGHSIIDSNEAVEL